MVPNSSEGLHPITAGNVDLQELGPWVREEVLAAAGSQAVDF